MIHRVETDELVRARTCKNYWTIPGITTEDKPEKLIDFIERVFLVDTAERTRKREIAEARHLWRKILFEQKKDPLCRVNKSRRENNKWSLNQIGLMTRCHHATVLHSVKVTENLYETDKGFREKADEVYRKINKGLIIFPK